MKKMLFFFLLLTITLVAKAGRTETIKVFSPSMNRNIDVTVTYPPTTRRHAPWCICCMAPLAITIRGWR